MSYSSYFVILVQKFSSPNFNLHLFYSDLLCSILFHFTLFYSILFYAMLPFAIPFNSILIYSILNFPKGGYGSVFKAWDLLTSTTVAVKLIDLEGTKYIKDC